MTRLANLCSFIVAISTLVVATPVTAQENGAQRDVDEGRAMVRAGFRDVIQTELILTEQEAAAFWPLYDTYEAAVSDVMDRYSRLITGYIDRFNEGDLTNEYADELLAEYFAIRQELLDVRRDHIPQFKAVLPPLKVAQLYQLENKLNAEVDIQLAMAIPLISE